MTVLGIHHVTAIASDPQRNLDFYVRVLGLRLVKRTINFDDPGTYHFYFGDDVGHPGSILTFFPWPGASRGRQGAGQAAVVSFAVPSGAIGFWVQRLLHYGVAYEGPIKGGSPTSASEQVISFKDPDGLLLEIVADQGAEERAAWDHAPGIPREHAIHGFCRVTLWVQSGEPTERILVDTLGFRLVHESGATRRFAAGDGGPSTIVDLRSIGGFPDGVEGTGVVHHVAWRVTDDANQLELRERVVRSGLAPTPVIDRQYFHSVYFREPGGILFELATDSPGFTIDESNEHLGERLMLPARYEPYRAEIEARLPVIHMPGQSSGAVLLASDPTS